MGRSGGVVAIGALAMLGAGCEVLFPIGGGADAGPGSDGAAVVDGPPGTDGAGPDDAAPDAFPDGPPGDYDGDMILDGVDNCPYHYNQQQRDEDFDGQGDPCDVCPGLGVFQFDNDADGVGDGCDLFPATYTAVVAKYFLEGGAPPTDWTASNGDWSVTFEQAYQGNETIDSASLMLDSVALPTDGDLWVEIGMTPVVLAPSLPASAGIWIDADASQPPVYGHYCEVGRSGDGTSVDIALVERVSSDFTLSANGSQQLFEAGTQVRVQALDRGDAGTDGFDCYEIPSGGTAGSLSAAQGTRRLGLHTRYAAALFGYVIIYHQPIPPT